MQTSATPNAVPSANDARMTVRTAAEPSAPDRECERRVRSAARTGGVSANQMVPAEQTTAATSTAAHGGPAAASTATITGPTTKNTSCSQASSANAVSRSSSAGSRLGQSARMQAPMGGSVAPTSAAQTASASTGASCIASRTRPPNDGRIDAAERQQHPRLADPVRKSPEERPGDGGGERRRREHDPGDRVGAPLATNQEQRRKRPHADGESRQQRCADDRCDARRSEQGGVAAQTRRRRADGILHGAGYGATQRRAPERKAPEAVPVRTQHERRAARGEW